MAQAHSEVSPSTSLNVVTGLGATERKDNWWIEPLLSGAVLASFVVYATFRAIYNGGYHVGPGTGVLEDHAYLLSPFYSPLIALPASLAWVSPAFLILWAPGGFRVTCYYYRKAYYRAFFADPPGCAVGEPGSFCGVPRKEQYKGETRLLLFQNLHRYFLYFALLFLVFLTLDVIHACRWPDGFGVSIGTLVLAGNTIMLAIYTFSCHSLRHLVGGRLDCFSTAPCGEARFQLWQCVSGLNQRHMLWAWISLFGVALADLYVWAVASGSVSDIRLF